MKHFLTALNPNKPLFSIIYDSLFFLSLCGLKEICEFVQPLQKSVLNFSRCKRLFNAKIIHLVLIINKPVTIFDYNPINFPSFSAV